MTHFYQFCFHFLNQNKKAGPHTHTAFIAITVAICMCVWVCVCMYVYMCLFISAEKKALNFNFSWWFPSQATQLAKLWIPRPPKNTEMPRNLKQVPLIILAVEAFCFHLPLLLKQFFRHDFKLPHLVFFSTDRFTLILSCSSQALALDIFARIDINTMVVFMSPPISRLPDVVSRALGSGADGAESSVIISCLPASDQNDRGSSH